MNLGLAGKTVIVTGGASNIGRAISHAFAREGSNVVVADIDEVQGEKVKRECAALDKGGRTVAIKTDVTDWNSIQAMVKKTLEEIGSIDVLVNNVGWTRDLFFWEKPMEDWEKEYKLNFWSTVHCIRAVLDHMMAKKSGKIVNIASDAARVGEPREAVYSGFKGGVVSLGKALARELGRSKINVNTVCPGVTVPKSMEEVSATHSLWTEETLAFLTPERQEKWAKTYPLGRLGNPEDIAGAVVFFASDAASFITGQVLSVSGGFSTAG